MVSGAGHQEPTLTTISFSLHIIYRRLRASPELRETPFWAKFEKMHHGGKTCFRKIVFTQSLGHRAQLAGGHTGRPALSCMQVCPQLPPQPGPRRPRPAPCWSPAPEAQRPLAGAPAASDPESPRTGRAPTTFRNKVSL